jgi:hypothetical protein
MTANAKAATGSQRETKKQASRLLDQDEKSGIESKAPLTTNRDQRLRAKTAKRNQQKPSRLTGLLESSHNRGLRWKRFGSQRKRGGRRKKESEN